MLHLTATLHLFGVRLIDTARHRIDLLAAEDSERGSETIEKVLWAVAVITIVGIVVTVIRNYVTSEAGKIS